MFFVSFFLLHTTIVLVRLPFSCKTRRSGSHLRERPMKTRGHWPTRIAISRLVLGAVSLLVVVCPRAPALDPSLDLTQYTHTAWTARDSLKGSTRSIVQTPDGYLWVGTEFGLVRFDGVRFVPWSPPPGQHLPSPNIIALLVARDGTLWIGTLGGLASWKDGRLIQYPEINAGVLAVLEDHEGTVWVGASGRLCSIRSGKTECQGINASSGTGLYYLYGNRGAGVTSLYEDSTHRLWAGTELGLWQWNPGPPKRYLSEPMDAYHAIVSGDRASGLVFISSSGYSGANYLLRQLSGDKIEKYSVPGVSGPFKAAHLLRDRDGALWIGTYDQGLLRVYQGKTSRFSLAQGLSGDLVTTLFEDREGSIWVGTTNGLDRFREPVISTLSAYQGVPSPVWSVLPANDGSLWMGSFDGLNRWNHGQLTIYRSNDPGEKQIGGHRPGAVSGVVRETTDPGLPDNIIGSLFEDHRGRIWVTTGKGVAWFENGRLTRVSGLPAGSANAIIADEDGGVWISYPVEGLLHVAHGAVVQSIPWPWFGEKKDPRLSALVPDSSKGGLWLGTLNAGIAYFKDGQVSTWLNTKNGLGADLVWNLHFDHEGTLWAATEGGLSRIKDGNISTLTTKNGLPCNPVHWVVEDDARSLWLSTACGLLRVNRSDLQAWASDAKQAIHPTILDGSDGFRMHAMLTGYSPVVKKAPDGKLWFAHNDGVSVIDPQNLRINKVPPPVHVEEITADGKTYAATASLQLPPRIRDLAIDYAALSLVAPEKVRFRFKLEGQDKDWREVANVRQVQYSNLAPGNYRFRVIASNNSGVWNEEGASLDFAITPAYYQTNWFRALCGLTFLAMLWTVYQLRVRALQRRQSVLERHRNEVRALNEQLIKAQEAERMRISGELHDGVLQQITSLTLRLGKVRNQVPPDSEAKATVSGLQQELIRIGTDIRHISHELHPALLQDAGLPQALSAYCEEFSKVRGLPVTCEADASVEELSPGAALCLYRIAQEALGNAAKHSAAKKVEVRLTRADGLVRLSVSDDGVGCDPNQLGKSGGLGVINMRERVLQLHGTFQFDSKPGRGTTVKAEVPFRPAL